ncbi:MAG TPA: acetate kinase [Bryobacteraceae bacterium]|nr:acetate kinase [Bryobacteraceae bacterium]
MKILVLNCGSASVKYRLIETSAALMAANEDRVLAGGAVEDTTCYERAVKTAIDLIGNHSEIDAVGHRIVHGGRFSSAVVMDDSVVREIEDVSALAPLHNPVHLCGYRASRAILPNCPHVAVFDTAFHQTIPRHAYLYAIPYDLYTRHNVRRFGFHGTSHRYVSLRYAQLQGRGPEAFRLITCHLGNGCSVCAVDRGRSVDTSMGFTPLEGLVMGSRAGDLDAGALLYLMEKEGLNIEETNRFLNRECGLRGVSGISNDMRELLACVERGDELARLAVEIFCYRVKKYIGACFAAMNGADAIVFTAGIGEHAAAVRERICESMGALGVRIDCEKNLAATGMEMDISAAGSATRVWVIPTREELLIARETLGAVLSASPIEAQ